MDDNIKLYGVCHFCTQKYEITLIDGITVRCMYCHQLNTNPFYNRKDSEMPQKRDTRTGRFVKTDIKNRSGDIIGVSKKKEYTTAFSDKEKSRPKSKGFWEVEIDCVKECSKVQKEVEVEIQPIVKRKVNYLMIKFPALEWLAYLLGCVVKEDDGLLYSVTDIHIPTQKVSSGLVWDVDCPEYNDLKPIGVLHSHHGMGNGFSPTDRDFVNSNHDISLVISKQGLAGQVRVETPCGSVKIVKDVKITHLLDDQIDDDFKAEIETKIETGANRKPKKGFVDKSKTRKKPLTESQQIYSNGSSVKDLDKQNNLDTQPHNESWGSDIIGMAVCPGCNAINDGDALRCEYCQEDL